MFPRLPRVLTLSTLQQLQNCLDISGTEARPSDYVRLRYSLRKNASSWNRYSYGRALACCHGFGLGIRYHASETNIRSFGCRKIIVLRTTCHVGQIRVVGLT